MPLRKEGQVIPYPQFNKGEKGAGWHIEDSGGGSNPAYMQGRVLRVPLEHTCALCEANGQMNVSHARTARAHEMAHVTFTTDKEGRQPRVPRDIPMDVFNAIEDVRIQRCIEARLPGQHLDKMICPVEKPKFVKAFKTAGDRDLVLYATAALGQGEEDILNWMKEAVEAREKEAPDDERLDFEFIEKLAQQAREQVDSHSRYHRVTHTDGSVRTEYWPHLKDTLTVSRWLRDMLKNLGLDPEDEKDKGKGDKSNQSNSAQGGQEGEQDEGGGDEGEQPDPDSFDPDTERPASEEEADPNFDSSDKSEYEPAQNDPNANASGNGWGEMQLENVPLTRPLPGRLRQSWASTDRGTMPGDLGRWMVDQRIFKTMRTFPGGTVLLDASGSMSLSQDQVYEVMLEFPGVTFACYSGNGTIGWLRIIADKGKVAAEGQLRTPGGTNTIDGPALEWLGRQKNKPLVWVSDGWVNGRSGYGGGDLDVQRDLLLARYNIKWVNPHNLPNDWDDVPHFVRRALRGGNARKMGGEKKKKVQA